MSTPMDSFVILFPLALMLGCVGLAAARILSGKPAAGPMHWLLASGFALGAIATVLSALILLDWNAVAIALRDAGQAWIATHHARLIPAMAVLGLLLTFGGAARAFHLHLHADPRGPMVSAGLPAMACMLGVGLIATWMAAQ